LFVNIKMRFFLVSVVLVLFSVHNATSFVSPILAGKSVAKKNVKAKVVSKPAQQKKNEKNTKPAFLSKAKKAAPTPVKGGKKAAPAPAKGGKKVAPAKAKAGKTNEKAKKASPVPAKGNPKFAFSFGQDKKASPTPAKVVKKAAPASPKANKKVVVKGKNEKKAPLKANIPKVGNVKAPESVSAPSVPGGFSPVVLAGTAMSSLKPLFSFETKVQAGVLSTVGGIIGVPFRVDQKGIRRDLKERTSSSKPVMYTYGLSPFSAEAINIVENYEVDVIELGPEWFFLGPNGSEKRLALAEISPDMQTSLPHLFAKGESLGGLSTGGRNNEGINGLVKSGAINSVLKRRRKTTNKPRRK